MTMKSTLSLLGLYRWDPTILDDLHIPAGINRSSLESELLLQCAEVEVIYPDPVTLKMAINLWSVSMLPIWEKMYATTVLKYDPISNYDRHEEWTDSRETSGSATSSSNSTTSSTDNGTTGNTSTSSRTGFNVDAGMQPAASSTDSGSTSSTSSGSGTGSSSGTSSGTEEATHTGRMWGNIGVTTSQQMIQSERDVAEFNIVQKIVYDFQARFCIMIY